MVNRDSLIDYLLHRMPESERLDFAERWFSEAELCQQLETTEVELLDGYARAELPRWQREGVERYLLNSAVQRRKLSFAAALAGVLPGRQSRRISWVAVSAAAMLVMLAGATLWIARQNQELRSEIAKLRTDFHPLAGGVYMASLTSSVRGSAAGTPLALPKDANIVRLELELNEGASRESYSATVLASGHAVWDEHPLRPESRGLASYVTMWIPARVLATGNYSVVLEIAGNPVAYYDLRIAP